MKYYKLFFTQLLCALSACCIPSFSQASSVSDLLITEIMANPSAVSDANGEWFELFNPTSDNISLEGIFLSDDGGNSLTFSNAGGNLLVGSGEYFVLARNGNTLTNGGFTADYVYGSDFSLTNIDDEIVFSDALDELLRFNYSSGFVANGASMELINEDTVNAIYAASTSLYGNGDFGTPGAAGAYAFSITPSPVPLPNALWLLSSGLLGFIGLMRKNAA
jgi:Lamin Tail Domain